MLNRYVLLIILLYVLFAYNVNSESFNTITPTDSVSLPRDLYYRDNFISEWWYFTGHLVSDNKRNFGFEVTFFVINVNKKDFKSPFGLKKIYMLHSAITDIDNNMFYYDTKITRGTYDSASVSKSNNIVYIDNNYLKGDINNFHVFSENNNFSIELSLKALKAPIKNGHNGYSQKVDNCSKCASLYFSITRLKTDGYLKINKNYYKVEGISWFDREINSEYDSSMVKGWDWFSIQLDNKTEIMLYLIRNTSGQIQSVSSGSIVYPDSTYKILQKEEFEVISLNNYISKKSKAKYPSKWKINIPSENLRFTITPLVKDQEIISNIPYFPSYWEGACKVEGAISGKAYVELTGYE